MRAAKASPGGLVALQYTARAGGKCLDMGRATGGLSQLRLKARETQSSRSDDDQLRTFGFIFGSDAIS